MTLNWVLENTLYDIRKRMHCTDFSDTKAKDCSDWVSVKKTIE